MDEHARKVLAAANQPHFNENGLLNAQIPPEKALQALSLTNQLPPQDLGNNS